MYDYEAFKKDVYKLTNINLELYKERQMKRRIEALISRHGYKGFEDFMKALGTDQKLLDIFVNHLTINVSEFYRNPRQWEIFENEILPYMVRRHGNRLKIWSAACSTGDEPYTIAMIMARHLPLENFRIIATDIDDEVLRKAKLGIYSDKSLAGLPRDLYKKYFTKTSDGKSCQISSDIKRCIEFRKHNLLEDLYFTDVHLIVCRNVVIYFTEEAKDMVYQKFCRALVPGGMMFIGSTEQLMHANELGFEIYRSFFYQKKAGGAMKPAAPSSIWNAHTPTYRPQADRISQGNERPASPYAARTGNQDNGMGKTEPADRTRRKGTFLSGNDRSKPGM